MSVTLFFSSASPGRDDYAVMFLTVNSADRTRWPRWTKGWASSGFHDNMPEESRDFLRLLPSKGKLCAELPCEAPQLGPVQRSHCCSQTLKVPRNSPEGACDHLPGTCFYHSPTAQLLPSTFSLLLPAHFPARLDLVSHCSCWSPPAKQPLLTHLPRIKGKGKFFLFALVQHE